MGTKHRGKEGRSVRRTPATFFIFLVGCGFNELQLLKGQPEEEVAGGRESEEG